MDLDLLSELEKCLLNELSETGELLFMILGNIC